MGLSFLDAHNWLFLWLRDIRLQRDHTNQDSMIEDSSYLVLPACRCLCQSTHVVNACPSRCRLMDHSPHVWWWSGSIRDQTATSKKTIRYMLMNFYLLVSCLLQHPFETLAFLFLFVLGSKILALNVIRYIHHVSSYVPLRISVQVCF